MRSRASSSSGTRWRSRLRRPIVEVCAVAKRDLEAGETLDQYGMYTTYGEAASTAEMSERRYLPEGLVVGCTLRRDIAKDEVITYDDVDLPAAVGRSSARRAAGAVQGRDVAGRAARHRRAEMGRA